MSQAAPRPRGYPKGLASHRPNRYREPRSAAFHEPFIGAIPREFTIVAWQNRHNPQDIPPRNECGSKARLDPLEWVLADDAPMTRAQAADLEAAGKATTALRHFSDRVELVVRARR